MKVRETFISDEHTENLAGHTALTCVLPDWKPWQHSRLVEIL